jgi:hypothetical protein
MSTSDPSDLTDGGMGVRPTLPAAALATRQTTHASLAAHPRRHLLGVAHRLCLALSAHHFPAMADGVLSLSAIPHQEHLTCALSVPASSRAGARRAAFGPERRYHGQPECEDRRGIGGIRGFDDGKLVKGRKRHLLVDTVGLPIAWYVTPADLSDAQGTRRLLGGLAYFVPRLKTIWADAAYRSKELADWCRQRGKAGIWRSWNGLYSPMASHSSRAGG